VVNSAGLERPFRSALRDHLKGHIEALGSLAVEMLARGLSVRDIEDAFKDETGRLLLSKTAVREIGKQLQGTSGLQEYDMPHLFIDRSPSGSVRSAVRADLGRVGEGNAEQCEPVHTFIGC
jgi:hypothetical protein